MKHLKINTLKIFASALIALMCFVSVAAQAQQYEPPSLITAKASSADASTEDWELYFGGPDKPVYHLRDMLGGWIDAQPQGGRIDFALYYFRDFVLADKLIEAHNRGVNVNLVIEGTPRKTDANREMISYLQASELSEKLHLVRSSKILKNGRLHSKIYAFSHPVPNVMIGSYNPSGSNDPDDPLGVQDTGHNLLFQTYDKALVNGLVSYTENLSGKTDNADKIEIDTKDHALFTFPRRDKNVGVDDVSNASKEAKVIGAISHMKWHPMIGAFKKAAKNGADVTLIVHETERRVPQRVFNNLKKAGVNIRRFNGGERYPMHAKFLLLEDRGKKTSWLGSYNWNIASRTKNKEVLLESYDAALHDALSARFDFIMSEVDGLSASPD